MKYLKSIVIHWKTSLAAILTLILTLMLWLGKITVEEWAMGLGTMGTLMGFLAKDWDKTSEK